MGHLFSNYAVWNNHARDISKSDLLSRQCRAQSSSSSVVVIGWSVCGAAVIFPASLVTAAATSKSRHSFIDTDTHQVFFGLIHLH